jgi:hypothetical protein
MYYIYILCYNEEDIIRQTISHYRKNIPDCHITIYDNYSTDNSITIALEENCEIVRFDTNNDLNDHVHRSIKNNCWKNIKHGWVIVVDMDEWLDITQKQLDIEHKNGTTLLKTHGLQMIGESKTKNASDICLNKIVKYVSDSEYSKKICFHVPEIKYMNYSVGAHISNPQGDVRYSKKTYILQHYNYLGFEYLVNKLQKRYKRSELMRKEGKAVHYRFANDLEWIRQTYNDMLIKSNKNYF